MQKLFSFLLILILSLSVTSSFVAFIPESKAQNGEPNNATSFFNTNLTEYWQTLNQHSAWDLEWYNVSLLEWVSVKSDLTVQRQYSMPDTCKLTLLFNASQTGDYRLTFGIDLRVKKYVQKLDQYQYELTYEGVSVIFDWSDVINITGLVVTHGVKNVDGTDYFWCRMQRDNVPQGAYLEIDPSVNIKPLSKETYYPSSYNAIGSTTPVSGSITDLQADDGVYATFRSYASANGTAISLGYSTASTTGSTTIESQIVGSLFTLSQNAWATQIMAYVGVTTAAKNAKCMIYRHSNLALMGTTVEISLPVATAWRTFTFSPYIWLPADDYIIDVWSATGSGNGVLYYATGTTNQGHIDPQTYGTVPNPLVPTSHNAYKYDVNCTLIPPSEYICDLEFTGTSNTQTWVELVWGSDCSFTTDSVTATFQLYNYQTSSYPQSGDGFMSDTMGNVDVNKTQTITVNPSDFRDASGNWKVKVKAVKSTNVQFDLKADFIDPTVIFATVSVTSVHTCPLDQRTFVIAYGDDTNDDVSFQIYDTNGTQILAETDADTTVGGTGYTAVGVTALTSNNFVIAWVDVPVTAITFAIYDRTGSLLNGPTNASTGIGTGLSVSVSAFNSTYFAIGWYDQAASDTTFSVYDSSSNLIAGPIDVDDTAGASMSVSVSALNSTHFVFGYFDKTESDVTFSVYTSSGTLVNGPTDADDAASASYAISVSTFNSTLFVIGWFDRATFPYNMTFAVYDSSAALKTGPIIVGIVGAGAYSVQTATLNSTAFVISFYDLIQFDLSYAIYDSVGTALVAWADVESWPTAANSPFFYQSVCSQETATGIALYNANWIIAYANTTTEAIWQAFTPAGAVWDGTIPEQGGPTALSVYGIIPITFGLSTLNAWVFNRYGSITMTYTLSDWHTFTQNIFGSLTATFSVLSEKTVEFSRSPSMIVTFSIQSLKTVDFLRESIITLTTSIDGKMSYTNGTFLNLFGIIPISFTLNSIRAWIFNRYPSIQATFTPSATSTFPTPKEQHGGFLQWLVSFIAFNLAQEKQPCINANVIIYEMPANRKLLNLTTDENGKVNATLPQGEYKYIATYQNQTIQGSFIQTGEATVQLEFNIATPIPLAKIGVGILIIGIGGIVIYNLNKQVKKKRKMRKPHAPEGHEEKRRKPNLKPKWKHPRPESEGYA